MYLSWRNSPGWFILFTKVHPDIDKAYHHHTQFFCQCVLGMMSTEDSTNWKEDFAMAAFYLQKQHRNLHAHRLNDNLYATFLYISGLNPGKVNEQLGNTFQHLLTNTNKSRILAGAASYCFQYISDYKSDLEQGLYRPIHIRSISRKIRQTRPWHWHRTFRSRLRTDQLLFKEGMQFPLTSLRKQVNKAKKDKNYQFFVRSIFSVDWKNGPSETRYLSPYFYMCYLDYFIKILPHTEPYAPLIKMCRTKTLSPMSTFFPALSRRARRVIGDYLERAESELGNGDVEVKWYIIDTLWQMRVLNFGTFYWSFCSFRNTYWRNMGRTLPV